jgi:dolichol-phosphate mannosyltransferase
MVRFGLVGASGVGVNMGCLWYFSEILGWGIGVSGVLAIEISVLTNFVLNDQWTWKDRIKKGLLKRCGQYHAAVGFSAVLNWVVLMSLTHFFGWHKLLANLCGIALGMVVNYLVNDLWTFRKK